MLQVEFLVGREIEVGRTYKGTVSSIKEYGAFVEFNGGQQGLLHISELSYEPVFLLRFCNRCVEAEYVSYFLFSKIALVDT